MIRAIVFDCFGVLATDGWLPFKSKYFAHEKALLQQATDLNKQSDAGLIEYDDFVQQIADLAGITLDDTRTAIEINGANKPLFDYIKTLKKDYKIGMLSNAAGNWLDRMFYPEQVALFDQIALSFETGFIKPHPESFQIILDRLGVEASEAVLIDDQPAYGAGAGAAGMHFILYKDNEQLIPELDALLADSKK